MQDVIQGFPKTIGERIYLYLKESIQNGKLKPNQRITEKEIANSFNVSTTPVRDAISKLAGEGLVIVTSHKDTYVKEIFYKDLIAIYHVMNFIDEFVMKLAFESRSEELIEEMEKLTVEMENACKKDTVDKYLDINERIHLKICKSIGNEFLYRIREQIYSQLSLYTPLRIFLFTRSNECEKSLKKHKLLLEAFKSRDKTKIEKAIHRHWINFLPSESEWEEYISQGEGKREIDLKEKLQDYF